MFEEVISNYFHPGYNIGLQDIGMPGALDHAGPP